VASQADLDKAIEQLRVAETDLRRAHAATAESRQQVVTAEKNLAYHQERLGYARILSPYDGLVIRRDRDPGGVVVPGSSILQLISTNEIWVSAWVDETAATGLAEGQAARVVFRSAPTRPVAGEVARLGRETDRETREFTVDVRIRELPANWTIGQRAEVFIQTASKSRVLAIPERFLQWRDAQAGVFLVQAGRASWRPITSGMRGQQQVEVVQGLAEGDRIAIPAGLKPSPLREGQRITPQ
jgi:RND family efflux transporter MFP subunit